MTYDVIVVGGGAMGSAAARELSKRGRRVLLLEQFERGHVRGGSHGASRIFRLAYPDVDYVHLAQRALILWRELEEEVGYQLLDQTGGVDHGVPEDRITDALEACDVAFEVLDPTDARRRWPGMRFETPVVFQSDAGRLNADKAVAALLDSATARGANVRFSVRVSSIEDTGDRVRVTTEDGVFEAPVAVIAAGAWAPRLLHNIQLPQITVTLEQPAYFRPLDGTVWPSFIHYRPGMVGTTDFAIYGLETPGEGIKVGEHMVGKTVDPDARSFEADPKLLESLSRYVTEWLPGLDPDPVSCITCLYDNTPSADFVLDRTRRLVIATGFSGHGFKFVPEIGRIAADLAEGDAMSTLDRFRLHWNSVHESVDWGEPEGREAW